MRCRMCSRGSLDMNAEQRFRLSCSRRSAIPLVAGRGRPPSGGADTQQKRDNDLDHFVPCSSLYIWTYIPFNGNLTAGTRRAAVT